MIPASTPGDTPAPKTTGIRIPARVITWLEGTSFGQELTDRAQHTDPRTTMYRKILAARTRLDNSAWVHLTRAELAELREEGQGFANIAAGYSSGHKGNKGRADLRAATAIIGLTTRALHRSA